MLFIKNAPGGSSLSNLSAWWRLVNATNYLLHPTEFTCLITVVSPGQFVCFFLDGTLTIAGIRVVGEKLQPARAALRRKFLEKSRHRHRIVPGLAIRCDPVKSAWLSAVRENLSSTLLAPNPIPSCPS